MSPPFPLLSVLYVVLIQRVERGEIRKRMKKKKKNRKKGSLNLKYARVGFRISPTLAIAPSSIFGYALGGTVLCRASVNIIVRIRALYGENPFR